MQQLEDAAFQRGVSASRLMEQAGVGIARVVRQFFPTPGLAVLYLGKGNNAGDALVVGRELLHAGWRVALRLSAEPGQFKPLPLEHWRSIATHAEQWDSSASALDHQGPLLLIDGLVGIGSTGALQGTLRLLAAEMNHVRRQCHAISIAMDLPSGLDSETGMPCDDAVVADLTVTVAVAKTCLLADAATGHVGRLAIVPLEELPEPPCNEQVITPRLLRPLLHKRSFDMHKGEAGRVGIIAGSPGFLGAAVLASLGALRGGAGLITLYAKPNAYALLAMKLPPEIMVKQVDDYAEATRGPDVLAIGPGLGFAHESEVLRIVHEAPQPVVVDADALTMLAKHGIASFAGPRLLTPHPGEMARFGVSTATRATLARSFASQHHVSLLLKGSRTIVASPDQPLRHNTTGSPGMATGGMGDVLSGLCAALIAQGMSTHDAASAGSWLLGRSAEIAITLGHASQESLSATDVAAHLGDAFTDLKHGVS